MWSSTVEARALVRPLPALPSSGAPASRPAVLSGLTTSSNPPPALPLRQTYASQCDYKHSLDGSVYRGADTGENIVSAAAAPERLRSHACTQMRACARLI